MKANRREFFKTAGAVTGGLLLAQDKAFGLGKSIPILTDDTKNWSVDSLLAGKSTMKVKTIETFTKNPLSIVRVTTDSGAEGFGQIAPFDADISATILHRKIAPHVLGKDPYALAAINEACIDRNLKFPWSFVCRALGGVDTALWDLRGKIENKSVCELLGGVPRSLGVYGSSMSRSITPEDEAKRLAGFRDSHGFRAFKIRVGTDAGHNKDAWPGRTEQLVPAVRKAIGPEVALLADANSCYTPDKAIEVGKMLEQNRVEHFEEPCPYWEYEWTAEVTAALKKLSVAGGEQDNDLAQWRRMIALPAMDIAQPDVCYVGGITRTLQVAQMAHRAGMKVVPHSANLSMVTVFSLHLMGAIPNAGNYVEYTIESNDWTNDLFEPVLRVRDGKVAIPNGPGWGVTINKKWLETAERQISSV
jgi:L-alanine-DL-glutamate epimerase-like enolase superfamily enzyme